MASGAFHSHFVLATQCGLATQCEFATIKNGQLFFYCLFYTVRAVGFTSLFYAEGAQGGDCYVQFLPPVSDDNPLGTHGVEGEFYAPPYSEEDFAGQNGSPDVIDMNRPPSTQPSLWLGWEINDDGELVWNKHEKFYEYRAWLDYLIEKIFAPQGLVLDGRFTYKGEDADDRGVIIVNNNVRQY